MVRNSFVRWIGGKEWLWKHIKPYLIADQHEIYIEPFLGGGAIAIHYIKWCRKHNVRKKFILSDNNAGLINAYIQIRDNFEDLVNYLDILDATTSTKALYYERRRIYNEIDKNSVRSAGLFIWLMANGWRGLYRVNKRNQLNASFQSAKSSCYSLKTLEILHDLFKDVIFRCCSFDQIEENGLIYLDPPYENTFQNYSINAPTNEEINKFISDHRDRSSIYISNNQYYKPPDESEVVIHMSICTKVKIHSDLSQEEYVWKV